MSRPLVVALTGGIGSGKTTASGMFAAIGTPVIDADEISRNITRPGGAAFKRVAELFGPSVVAADGELRRDLIRKAVFGDESLRTKLEAIVHPLVWAEVRERTTAVQAPYCIVSVPLLLETGRTGAFDRVLVVDAPEELQLRRVSERDGLPGEEIRRIIGNQAARDARLRAAHDVIRNDGDLGQLRTEVERLHRSYLGMAEKRLRVPPE